jgi:hypothetical protein
LKGKKYKELRQSTFAVEVTKGNYVVMVFKRVEGRPTGSGDGPQRPLIYSMPQEYSRLSELKEDYNIRKKKARGRSKIN